VVRKSFLTSVFHGPGRASLRFLRVGVLGLAMATGTMVGCGDSDDGADDVAEAPKEKAPMPGGGPSAGGAAPSAGGAANQGSSNQSQQASRSPVAGGGGSRSPMMGGGGGRSGPMAGGGGGRAGSQGGRSGGNARGGRPQIPGPPPRPEEFGKWTANHFRDAVRERDMNAENAVKWLGDNKPDDATAGLLVEMLALLNEPAKEPPAGARGGAPGGQRKQFQRQGPALREGGGPMAPGMPSGPPKDGGGGAGGAVAQLNDAVLKQTILAALRGRMSSTLLTSVVMQTGGDGMQEGYPGQNGPPEGYPGGGGQNGPPEGYPGGGGGQNGPPAGYPGGGGGMQEGYPGAGGSQDGPPEGYPGGGDGMQEGYPGAGQGSSSGGFPGAGGGLAGGGSTPPNSSAGAYAHYGTMDVDQFIKTSIGILLKLDTPRAWDAVSQMLAGSLELPMQAADVSKIVLTQLIASYGGENHPTHSLITDTMGSASRDSLLSTLTGYAITSADRLLGLNAGIPGQPAQRPGRGRGLQGGAPRGPAGPGMGGPGLPGDPGAPGGSLPGGGQNSPPPPPAGAPLTMDATPKTMAEGEIKKITALLFSEDFGAQVVDGLSNAGSPADVPQLLALASSLPTTPIRRAQYQMLNNARKLGPQNLIDAGFFTKVAHDPGLLVTLGSLPRARDDSLVQKQWDDAHKDAVLAFRDRLKLASQGAGGVLEVRKPTPMTLHKGYSNHVAASFQKKWPRDVGGMIGDVEPGSTEVRYIRLEVPEPDKNGKSILSHYKKGSKTNDEFDDQRKVFWFSRVRDIRNTPLRRSVNVLISQGRSGGGAAAGGGAGLGGGAGFAGGGQGGGGGSSVIIVEIISVDTANPRDSGVTNAKLDR